MTALISRDELKAAIDARAVTVVDALGEHYWAQQHLPGAIYLVEGDVEAKADALLPDRNCGQARGLACPSIRGMPPQTLLGDGNIRMLVLPSNM